MKPHTKLYWIGAMLVGASVLLAGIAILGGRTSPAGYVASNYTRAPHLDNNDTAYLADLPPSAVRKDITEAWTPLGEYADGSGIYLRYSDDVIAIFPAMKGSVIRVDDADDSYRRYYSVVGGHWGWPSGAGERARGGGPGSGK